MSDKGRQKRSQKERSDVQEEGVQQEIDSQDQPSSSWSDTIAAEERRQPRVSLPESDDEQGSTEQEGWNFNTPESSEHSRSSSSSSASPLRRVSTYQNPQVSTVANPTMSANTVEIGGEMITLSTTENTIQDVPKALFKKQDRVQLPQKERLDTISKATHRVLPKSSLLALLTPHFTAKDVLRDTKETSDCVNLLKSQAELYDFADVFWVVRYPKDAPTPTTQHNLFEEYMTITPEEVARSNEWYRKYVDSQAHPWIEENLQLGDTLLQNNMTEGLWQEIQTDYVKYPVSQRGGPLIFILAMQAMQRNDDQCLTNLASTVKHMKLSEQDGEDVDEVCNLVMGGLKRLRGGTKFVTTDGKTVYRYLPDDFRLSVLKMLQTSSVEQFNAIFALEELEYRKRQSMPGAIIDQGCDDKAIDDLLKQAKNLYHTLCESSEWTGVKSKGSHSTFTAEGRSGIGPCWTCGQYGHLSRDCTLPDDQQDSEAIRKRKEESREKSRLRWGGRGGRGGRGRGGRTQSSSQPPSSGKWAKPAKSERGKRTIEVNGAMVAHHWDGNKSQWVADATVPVQVPTQVSVPPQALLSGHDSTGTRSIASSQQPNNGGMNPQTGSLAADSIDAAANAARLAATQRMSNFMNQIGN